MSIATFEVVTAGATHDAAVSVGAVHPNRAVDVQVWTSVTAIPPADRPRGTPTLIVLPGFRKALSARVYMGAEDVAIEDPATGVFGAGDDFLAAVADFQEALQDHLAVLAESGTLAPALQRQLDTLRGYFSNP